MRKRVNMDASKTMDTQTEILRSLQKMPFFKNVDEKDLAPFVGKAKKRSLNRDEIIFTADEKCRNLHILHTGMLKIFVLSPDGREQIIHFLKPVVVFGEDILFGEDLYEASAKACRETVIFDIGKKDVEDFLHIHPQVGIAMLTYLGKKVRRLTRMIADLALKDVQGRLVCQLVQMASDQGERTEGGILIEGMTQEELACATGAVREHLNRCLSRLQEARLIKLDRKKIIIQDMESLVSLSQKSEPFLSI
jgi:CRP/FNR family transcriptional regulator